MSEDESVKGDPNSTRLLNRLMDKFDGVLFAHGFVFKEDMAWEEMGEEITALVYKYYDDETGGDSSYDPDKPPDSTGSDVEATPEGEDDDDGSMTLGSSTSESPAPQKKQKQ